MQKKLLILTLSTALAVTSLSGCGLYSTELGHIVEETEEAKEASEQASTEEATEEKPEEEEPEKAEVIDDEETSDTEAETEKPVKKSASKNSVSSNKKGKKTTSRNKADKKDSSEKESENEEQDEAVSDPFHTTETAFYTRDNIDTCLNLVNSCTYGDEAAASNLSSAGNPVTYAFYDKKSNLLFSILDFESNDHVQIVTADGETHNYIRSYGTDTGKYSVSRLEISTDNKAEKLAHLMLKGNTSYTYSISKNYDIAKDLDTDINATERITIDAPSPYGYTQIYYCEDDDDASTLVKDAVSAYKNKDDDIRIYKSGRVAVVLFSPTSAMIDALEDYDYDKQSMSGGTTETSPDDNTNPESN